MVKFAKSFLMQKYYLLIFIFFLFSCDDDLTDDNGSVNDNDDNDIEVSFDVDVGDSQIPYITITTQTDIQNEPKVSATMKIYQEKVLVQEESIGIEYRGSTSFRLSDKKSFGIETWDAAGNDRDASFFGFPEEEDWILQGHIVNPGENYIFDRTLIYNHIGYRVFENMGQYSSRTELVELELNGEYLGVYVFMEKLKRDNDRIDVTPLLPSENDASTISGGYILKIDKTAGGDVAPNQPLEYYENNWEDDARYTADNSFRSMYDINRELITFPPYQPPYHPQQYLETYFLYEYPDADEISTQQKQYIQEYIDAFETALLEDDFSTDVRTYTDYIDLDSFVDFFIINEITKNIDGYRLSTYLHKDRDTKLKMGPIWDLNIAYDYGDRVPMDDWVINYNLYVNQDAWMLPFWWPRLMEDPQFRSALKSRWNELRGGVLSTGALMGMVDEAVSLLKVNQAVDRNYDRWNISPQVNYDASISAMKDFLSERTAWMDAEISGM